MAVEDRGKALHESKLVLGGLKEAVFIVNVEKSEWKPSTKVEWLGFMSKGEFSIPVEKINALKARLLEIKEYWLRAS